MAKASDNTSPDAAAPADEAAAAAAAAPVETPNETPGPPPAPALPPAPPTPQDEEDAQVAQLKALLVAEGGEALWERVSFHPLQDGTPLSAGVAIRADDQDTANYAAGLLCQALPVPEGSPEGAAWKHVGTGPDLENPGRFTYIRVA